MNVTVRCTLKPRAGQMLQIFWCAAPRKNIERRTQGQKVQCSKCYKYFGALHQGRTLRAAAKCYKYFGALHQGKILKGAAKAKRCTACLKHPRNQCYGALHLKTEGRANATSCTKEGH